MYLPLTSPAFKRSLLWPNRVPAQLFICSGVSGRLAALPTRVGGTAPGSRQEACIGSRNSLLMRERRRICWLPDRRTTYFSTCAPRTTCWIRGMMLVCASPRLPLCPFFFIGHPLYFSLFSFSLSVAARLVRSLVVLSLFRTHSHLRANSHPVRLADFIVVALCARPDHGAHGCRLRCRSHTCGANERPRRPLQRWR